MSTALDRIKKAMRLNGSLGQGEEPTASEAADGLSSLNSMLESWSLERLLVFYILQENFTWSSGQASRTIGSGGNFDTTRPTRIEGGFTRISGIDYHIKHILSREQYDAIPDKTTQSAYPESIFYEEAYPLGVIYGLPVPDSNISIYLNSWKQLQSFPLLTTSVSLPPGYQRAIDYNLSIEMASEYGKSVTAEVKEIARVSKANIKSLNRPSMVAQLDAGIVGTGYRSDIVAGQ